MNAVFFDINIILDIFLKREPLYAASAEVFSLVEMRRFDGHLGALSYPTLFYILRKELGREPATNILKKIRIGLRTAPVLEKVIDSALGSTSKDFEDAIQYYAALEAKSDYFITRNKAGFPSTPLLRILTPEELLALTKSETAQ